MKVEKLGREGFEAGSRNAAFDELRRDKGGKKEDEKVIKDGRWDVERVGR